MKKNLKKIHRGEGPLPEKTYLGGPKEKIWKIFFWKKMFSIFFQIFLSLYFFQSQVGLFQKKFWKNSEENSEKINRGDPYLKKTYLGGPKEKIWKKNLKKKLFNKKVSGYMVYIIEISFWKFWKKKLDFFPLVPQGRFFPEKTYLEKSRITLFPTYSC